LSTLGDALDNTITTSRDAAGAILINGGTVPIQGGTPTVANTSQMQVFGQGGNDILLGKGGNDILFGEDGNDTPTSGDGDHQIFGGAGDDRMIWNPGDDTDLNEGGDGIDTSEAKGGNGAEVFTITANGTRVRFDRLNPAPFSIDIGRMRSRPQVRSASSRTAPATPSSRATWTTTSAPTSGSSCTPSPLSCKPATSCSDRQDAT
jgi:hypothetical protein